MQKSGEASLFRNRNFLTLWIGQSVSALGNPFTALATAWYVYNLTGSKIALGGVMLANTLPLAAMRLFAGTLVDRLDRRRIMLITDWVRTICLALVVVQLLTGKGHLWYFYVMNVFLGIGEAFFQPAAFAMVPNLIRKDQLIQANSLMNTTMTVSMLAGPTLAGLVVGWFGAVTALSVDTITFAISALSLFLLPAQIPPAVQRRHFLREVGSGFQFYVQHPGLLWLVSLASISNVVTGMILVVLLPYAVHHLHVGAQGYGLIETFVGVGFLVGSILSSRFKKYFRRKVMIPAHVFSGLAIFFLWIANDLWVVLLLSLGFGTGVAVWNTFSGTFYQEMVPDEYRGRVQSVRLLLAQGSTPLGMAVGPTLTAWMTIQVVFVLAGGLIMLSGVIAYPRPSVVKLDELDRQRRKAALQAPPAEGVST